MTPDKLRIVAFDCDGVMFDSRQANRAFYNAILEHLGLAPLRSRQMEKVQMLTVDQALAYLIDDPDALREAVRYKARLDYLEFVSLLEIEPYLKPLLAALRPAYRTAVATNRTNTMEAVLRRYGLEDCFDLVVTAWDVEKPKPHPEALEKILAAFGCRPDQMLFVGDSGVDQEAARAAGVWFAAYRNQALEAHVHLSGLDQVADMLGLCLDTGSA